jgi:phosphate starvation-inducible protein PhoH
VEEIMTFESLDILSNLFGHLDENIRRIEGELKVSVTNRGETLKISGDPEDVADAKKVFVGLISNSAKTHLASPRISPLLNTEMFWCRP